MKQFTLTCCSTADMPRSYFNEREIPFVCFHFNMDGKEYPDDLGETMPFAEFYQKIIDGAQPTTSQINMQSYIDFFTPILERGEDILHLTLSSGISGTYSSCVSAAQELKESFPERKIVVIDSLAASSGYGLFVDYAADLRDSGISIEEAEKDILANRQKLHHEVFSSDLTSYFRGGRISKASFVMGGLLNICPIIFVNKEGQLIVTGKARGKKKAIEHLLKKMETEAENGLDYSRKCFICHSNCYDDARKLADMIEERFTKLDGKVLINNIGTVIGSHTGVGTVALFYWGNERDN